MPVTLATFKGAPQGMVREVEQHEVPDSGTWTLVDGFLKGSDIWRRGPVESASAPVAAADSIGLAETYDPAGTWQSIHLVRTATAGSARGFENSSMATAWPYQPSVTELFDTAPALLGGQVIGTASDYGDAPAHSAVALWQGAGKDATAALTLTGDIAIGATTFTVASGGDTLCSGHFVFTDQTQLVGVVESVSGQVATLTHPALIAVASATRTVKGVPFRDIVPRASKGRITTATTSAVVNGGETRFRAQGLGSGTWDIYTPDYVYIGTVTSVESDTQLTLTGSSAVALVNSDYLAIKRTGQSYALTAHNVGWITATHAGHQFYWKGNVLSYSDNDDPEALYVDAADADTIVFSDDEGRALVSTEAGLVALTENKAYGLIGAVGTTPDRWRGNPIHDDGTICSMTAIAYKSGAVWAGKRGIWFWDGSAPVNVAGQLGDAYARFIAGAEDSRAYAMIHNNYYFLFVESSTADTEFQVIKDEETADVTNLGRLTFAVDLQTGACSILRNVNIRGNMEHVPGSSEIGETYFSVTTEDSEAVIARGSSLFAFEGRDEFACKDDTAGPDLYVETKKYDMGDPQRLKLLKLMLLWYLMDGDVYEQDDIDDGTADHLRFATVKGLDKTGETSSTKLYVKVDGEPVWQDKRVKFMKRSQFLALRMWQGTDTINQLALSAWAIGFKWKRAGRV